MDLPKRLSVAADWPGIRSNRELMTGLSEQIVSQKMDLPLCPWVTADRLRIRSNRELIVDQTGDGTGAGFFFFFVDVVGGGFHKNGPSTTPFGHGGRAQDTLQ